MKLIILIAVILILPAAGMTPLGTRALAMGGAQVALVDDATAAFWNPAAFGIKDGFSSTDTLFGFMAEDNLTQYTSALYRFSDLQGELPDNYRDFMEYMEENPDEAHAKLDDIVSSLAAFNDPGVGVVWDLHSGVATRVGPAVVSWLYERRVEVGPWVDTHLSRLIPPQFLFSPDNVQALYDEGLLSDEEMELLWPGYDPEDPDITLFVGNRMGDGIGLEENRSLLTLAGLELHTLAVSYGHSFELTRNDHIAVGGSLKYIHGTRSGYSYKILSGADLDDFDPKAFDIGTNWVMNNLFTLKRLSSAHGFGVDLGVQGSLGRQFRYGLLLRNIIPPLLVWDDPRFPATRLRPELRLGGAYQIIKGLTLALDLDLLAVENLSTVFNPESGVDEGVASHRERDLALGAEYELAGVVTFRAGMSTNYNALFSDSSPANFILSAGVAFDIGEVFRMSLAVMSNLVRPTGVDASLGCSLSLGFTL